MKTLSCVVIALLLASVWASAETKATGEQVLRGWLSDEKCARGRASSGIYTATGPNCAKECVAAGRKIVFIDPEGKRVLLIANQAAAKSNVGDKVEITGVLDPQAKSVRVVSLKMLERGVAMCSRNKEGQ